MAAYFNSEWVNLTSLFFGFVGVIGVILAIVFYFRSIRVPLPAYAIVWRTRIVDKATSTTPGLQVLHDGVAIVGKDVTSATIFVWNAGRAPIRKADVLRPYTFHLGEDGTLLHADILKATRQECGISISFPEPQSNKVDLNFDVLEYRDGAAVQLIFAGEPDTPISMAGVCVGAENIKDATIEYRNNQFNYAIWIKGTVAGFLLFLFGVTAIVVAIKGPSIIGTVEAIMFGIFGLVGLYGFIASFRIKAGSYNSSLRRLADASVDTQRRKKKKKK